MVGEDNVREVVAMVMYDINSTSARQASKLDRSVTNSVYCTARTGEWITEFHRNQQMSYMITVHDDFQLDSLQKDRARSGG